MNLRLEYPKASRGRIAVWGYLASRPFGGMTWQVLHHIVGLRLLGFDVWFVDDSDNEFQHPDTWWPTEDISANVAFVATQMERLGLGDRWVIRKPGTDEFYGSLDSAGLDRLYRDVDVVFDVCQSTRLRPRHDAIRRLVLLQTDPVVTQVAAAEGHEGVVHDLRRYHCLFTYGANIGLPGCGVPSGPFEWLPTRPPVVMEWWRSTRPPDGPLTTVANWMDHGNDLEWKGEVYRWSKDLEFQRFAHIAGALPLPVELALAGVDEHRVRSLRESGWRVSSARDLADPMVYRSFIQRSFGEFTTAKDQNIRLRSGWFSDRSACYLAAGRPVITQTTGFEDSIPTGSGLIAFAEPDEAVAAVRSVVDDYEHHRDAASALADEYFESRKVLGSVVDRIDAHG